NPTHAPYTFTSFVKQSNDFNGTGNDFVITSPQPAVDIVGQCSLAFGTQPASQQKASDITGDAFGPPLAPPSDAPIQVRVVDGGGSNTVTWWLTAITLGIATNPGNGTLSGSTSANPVNGIATFSGTPGPRIDNSASGYQLNATSTGQGQTDSILATAP